MHYSIKVSFALANLFFIRRSDCVPFIVQSLSSNYGLVLGGYGPGYEELRKIEVVRHNKVCPEVIRYEYFRITFVSCAKYNLNAMLTLLQILYLTNFYLYVVTK